MTGIPDPAIAETELSATLARNIARLRRARKISLDALAHRSGLSKGTVVALERGSANPSIGVLCRLAAAFALSVSDLMREAPDPQRLGAIERSVPVRLWSSIHGSSAILLASSSGNPMFELWSWIIMPGDSFAADAHSANTMELIAVTTGALAITVGQDKILLRPGEAARLITDCPHFYAAEGDEPARFTMSVLESVA